MSAPATRKVGRGLIIYFALVASHTVAFLAGFWVCYQVALQVIAERLGS